jgi:hypothetical protein
MRRYFFDVFSQTSIRYDYQGREFLTPDDARTFAELVALDMGCSDDSEPAEEIQVRNVRGEHLFSVEIQNSALIAA